MRATLHTAHVFYVMLLLLLFSRLAEQLMKRKPNRYLVLYYNNHEKSSKNQSSGVGSGLGGAVSSFLGEHLRETASKVVQNGLPEDFMA
eukprot:IDg1109t1